MAFTEKLYLNYAGLQKYDELIKSKISTEDAKAIKTVLWDGTAEQIKFFKKENATLSDTADYAVGVSSSDVANLKTRVGMTSTLNAYQSKSNVTDIINVLTGADTVDGSVAKLVKTLDDAIQGTNGTLTAEIANRKAADGTLTDLTTDAKGNLVAAINEVDAHADAAQSDVDALETLVGALPEAATATTVVGYVDEKVGALDSALAAVAKSGKAADVSIEDTAEKITATTVEGALAELAEAISSTGTAGVVTCEKDTSVSGIAARYTFKQGGNAIANAVVDIPKDMVVESGEVVTNPEGKPAGTYIVLTLANKTEDKLYIDVTTLIEYVTGGDTAEIKVAVDATTHVVTATVDKIAATKIIYKAAEGEQAEVTVASAIASLEAASSTGVDAKIKTAIEALDAEKSQAAGTDGLALSITEVDGKITAISGSIAAETYDAYGQAQAAYDAIKSIPLTGEGSIAALFA